MRKIYLNAALLLSLFFCSSVLFAQNNWTGVSEGALRKDLFSGRYKPSAYRLFQLNEVAMQQQLRRAPLRSAVPAESSSLIITIPDADGNPIRFKSVESPVMDPALAAKYPEIRSYFGQGIDDPASTIYFDFSPRGFHAMVFSVTKKTMYIDPVDREGKYYVAFSRNDADNNTSVFSCETPVSSTQDTPTPSLTTGRGADDARLRTYRLALASSGEYSAYFLDGTETTDTQKKAKVLAAMAALLTRTNGIFERDLGVHMNLVANNDQVIYLNAATDPWNSLNSTWDTTTQVMLDNVIGSFNYDIGHFITQGSDNGNAGCIACVCKSWNGQNGDTNGPFVGKGGGFTSHQNPEGDPFVVDYTTHEMGHQFGANHTFSFAIESGSVVQMEPGSGSTIMGYAGITGTPDIQAHSDDYFHSASIQQITDYVKGTTGGGCAVVTNTGNNIPTADAGADYIIPAGTPFTLTGAGTDADAADVLSYTWEQFNDATASQVTPPANSLVGPFFRSRPYNASNSRTFPPLNDILNNNNVSKWEVLPARLAAPALPTAPLNDRALVFRFTVRDNRPGGGGTRDDDMQLRIPQETGPFQVTSPNSAVSWGAGTDQTITWSVGGSDAAPINCTNVKISLSYDGGLTFPTVLLASTPNDGSAEIQLPANTSSQARIKVEAVGNIFFDISNINFNITGPEFNFNSPAAAIITCGQTTSSITLATTASLGFNTPVTLSAISGVPAGTTVMFGTNPVNPGSSSLITLNNVNLLTAGTSYDITIQGVAGAIIKTRVLRFTVESLTPPAITAQPQAISACIASNTSFSVTATNAVSYQWQLSTNGGAAYSPAPGTNNTATYSISNATIDMNGYRYRVQVNGTCSQTITSNAAILTVIAPVTISRQPSNITICETGNITFVTEGTSTIPVIYQWQVSTNGGTAFTNITNGGSYAGATTATLAVNNVAASMNNYQYRALLSSATCTSPAITSTAALTVNARPTVQLTASPLTDLLPGQTTTISATISPAPTGFNISWTRDDQLLPGIIGTGYLVDSVEVGNYQVGIVNPTTGCNNRSNVLTIGATASANLFIFPTPNDGRFTVSYYNSTGSAAKQTLAIYDTRGQQVYSAQLNVNGPYTLHDINIRGKAKGIYYVVIGDGSGKKITEGKVMIY